MLDDFCGKGRLVISDFLERSSHVVGEAALMSWGERALRSWGERALRFMGRSLMSWGGGFPCDFLNALILYS